MHICRFASVGPCPINLLAPLSFPQTYESIHSPLFRHPLTALLHERLVKMSRHVNERLPLEIIPTSNIGTSHSPPRSPHSTASLPSPPSSPNHRDRDQISIPGSPSSLASDLPLSSLNSSFFLSEQSSPILNPIISEDASRTLIMPSLTLPTSRHDPPTGESIGNVRLWLMGRRSHGCRSVAQSLLDSPLVMHMDPWTNTVDDYPVLRASTTASSSEVRSRRNIEVSLVEYDENDVGICTMSLAHA